MSNANYVSTPAELSAFAIEKRIQAKWENTWLKRSPLAACLADKDEIYKGVTINGTKAIVPVQHAAVSGPTTGNIGIARASQIPTAFPTFDALGGFTQAEYEFTQIERSLTVDQNEIMRGSNGARGNLLEGKTNQFMNTLASLMYDMCSGSANGSATALAGQDYILSATNVYGNIDATANAHWRALIDATGGTNNLASMGKMYDLLCQEASDFGDDETANGPDLITMSNVVGGPNVYGNFRELLNPAGRFEFKDFKVKYGISNIQWLGAKVVQESRGIGGAASTGRVRYFNTSSWFWVGNKLPKALSTQRIIGSSANETRYMLWACWGCKNRRFNGMQTVLAG
jgi:hypothetical protein